MAVSLQTPLTEADVRSLAVGDEVLISGILYTGRDAVHKHLFSGGVVPVDLNGQILYHCGPVILEKDGGYVVAGAGPTTSSREEPYQATIIEKFGIRAVIGKGGMGDRTAAACQKFGCVYLHAVGGAAQVYARTIQRVLGVHLKEEFGSPEAIWVFEVKDFPAVVTIDARGGSLHAELKEQTLQNVLERLATPPAGH